MRSLQFTFVNFSGPIQTNVVANENNLVTTLCDVTKEARVLSTNFRHGHTLDIYFEQFTVTLDEKLNLFILSYTRQHKK